MVNVKVIIPYMDPKGWVNFIIIHQPVLQPLYLDLFVFDAWKKWPKNIMATQIVVEKWQFRMVQSATKSPRISFKTKSDSLHQSP